MNKGEFPKSLSPFDPTYDKIIDNMCKKINITVKSL